MSRHERQHSDEIEKWLLELDIEENDHSQIEKNKLYFMIKHIRHRRCKIKLENGEWKFIEFIEDQDRFRDRSKAAFCILYYDKYLKDYNYEFDKKLKPILYEADILELESFIKNCFHHYRRPS